MAFRIHATNATYCSMHQDCIYHKISYSRDVWFWGMPYKGYVNLRRKKKQRRTDSPFGTFTWRHNHSRVNGGSWIWSWIAFNCCGCRFDGNTLCLFGKGTMLIRRVPLCRATEETDDRTNQRHVMFDVLLFFPQLRCFDTSRIKNNNISSVEYSTVRLSTRWNVVICGN